MWEYENCTKFIKINLTTTIHIAMMALEQNGNGDTGEGCGVLITRETDVALRVLRALSEGEQLTAGDISEQQMVPKPFAYKIIKKLSKAGFVRITRGADGGCRLAVGLDKVTLYDHRLHGAGLFLPLAGSPRRLHGSLPAGACTAKAA